MIRAAVVPTQAAERGLSVAAGHIHLYQFPLAGSDDRCHGIDGAARLFSSGSGLTRANRTVLFGRKVRRWRTPNASPPRLLHASVYPRRWHRRASQMRFDAPVGATGAAKENATINIQHR